MTEKEFEQLKVGDIVWMLCLDEKPGVAVKCEVTKPANDCGIVTTKCVGRPDCKGHYLYYGEVSKTEVEVYEKAIDRAESSIADNEEQIDDCQSDIAKKKVEIEKLKEKLKEAKGKEEEESWGVDFNNGRVFKTLNDVAYLDTRKWGYKTEQEAYEALADYYKGKYEEALVKAGKTMWYIASDDRIVMITNAHLREACICEGVNYDGNIEERHYNCHSLFSSRQEAEAELERRKK